ncbi:MAG: hypothetical protein LBR61_10300 [Synergistaceae bacterium]|nr:hypothetical protein [Synergistaceae bacterium]
MRLFILLLSMGCVISYGYALAGYIGYSLGAGRPDYIAWGLTLGTLCGGAALWFWKKWLPCFYIEEERAHEEEHAPEKEKPRDDSENKISGL